VTINATNIAIDTVLVNDSNGLGS
jgi:hypothetical protein